MRLIVVLSAYVNIADYLYLSYTIVKAILNPIDIANYMYIYLMGI